MRADIAELGPLTGTRRSSAEICYALARYLDDLMGRPGTGGPAPVARELAARLAELELTSTGREGSHADALAAEVADELAPRRVLRTSAPTGT